MRSKRFNSYLIHTPDFISQPTQVHDSRAQLETLTGSVAELILTLDRKLKDQPDLASSIDEELKSLRM